ncbi:MAG: PP2C family protein-serine/threonine phosphatase [Bacteroidota bacterium]
MSEQDPLIARLQEENLRLRRAVEELSILNDLARTIAASLDPQEIMGTIIRRSLRAVNAEQGVITLVEQAAADPMKTLVRANLSSSGQETFHLNQALVGWMHLNKMPLLVNTPQSDDRFRGVKWDLTIRTILCVPMMIKSELKGVLTVYNKKEGKAFSEEDQRLLAIIAGQSAQIIENARLNDGEKRFVKMQEEVRLAARIQTDLLPKEPPVVPGYDISGITIPAQEVGGDYFDFITIDNDRLGICLGDVTGKGLPASLLMANTQATLRGQALFDISVRECITRSNKLLFQSTNPEKFVTLFYGYLNQVNHQLSYCNAGHEPPILLRSDGSLLTLNTGGLALAMLEAFPFEEETVSLLPGDVLLICSDGITEAMNTMQEQFGTERLEQVIRSHRGSTSAQLINAIVDTVRKHAGAAPQTDDMTLIAINRQA